MAQPPSNSPSVLMNTSGNRLQVPLRDYLNIRVAPFLKNAITESLDAEAEFPLQWLGEYLIHQSILYEGNTDTTGIQERFRYKFDLPKAQPETTPEPEIKPEINGTTAHSNTAPEPERIQTSEPQTELSASHANVEQPSSLPPPSSPQPSSINASRDEERRDDDTMADVAPAATEDSQMGGTS